MGGKSRRWGGGMFADKKKNLNEANSRGEQEKGWNKVESPSTLAAFVASRC